MAIWDIWERSFQFAVRIVKLVNGMGNTVAGAVVARQVMRAGTSVGANVEEAQGSPSKKDFTRRLNIARGEAREVLYWLRLAKASELVSGGEVEELRAEADELVRILTAIVKRSRAEEPSPS